MDFPGNYRELGHVAVDALAALVPSREDAVWDQLGRHTKFSAHAHTRTIVFNNLPLSWDGRDYAPERMGPEGELADAVWEIAHKVAAQAGKRNGRVLLINLFAGGVIEEHVDTGPYLSQCQRVHVPVITNPGVRFCVGGEDRHLQAGECVEINNMRRHHVENRSDSDRVHLVCDLV